MWIFFSTNVQLQALEADPGAVIPNAEAFCLRGSSRLGQGKALEALDDCYRALSLVSLEVNLRQSDVHISTACERQHVICRVGLVLVLRGSSISSCLVIEDSGFSEVK